MNNNGIAKGIVNATLQLSLIFFGIWLIVELHILLIYICIAFVVSLIGRPIVFFLKSKLKFSNLLAASITLLILIGILAGIISLFIPLIIQQGENLSLLNLEELELNVKKILEEISVHFNLKSNFWDSIPTNESLFSNDYLSAIPEFLNQLLSVLGNMTIGMFSVTFISFFLLKDSLLMERGAMLLVNDRDENRLKKSFEKIKDLLSRYFLGLLLQISILLIIYTIILVVFGIQNAFVIAFLCALLNLIPYVGPLIGGVLMIFLSMTSNLDAEFSTVILPKTIYVMIGFSIGQLIDNFFSQPMIFSNSVKSHPLEIFIVILAGGSLMGSVGMIVAIPIYTSIKVMLKEFLSENKIIKSLTHDL
jgi:predicted PurR-regulated permease PerM